MGFRAPRTSGLLRSGIRRSGQRQGCLLLGGPGAASLKRAPTLALRRARRASLRGAAARARRQPGGTAQVVPGYGRSGGSPWQATQIVLVLYWNPLLLRAELIRYIWIHCSINSNLLEIPYFPWSAQVGTESSAGLD